MNLKNLAIALLVVVPALAQAQTVSYSLPQTTVTVEVDAVQESFFARHRGGGRRAGILLRRSVRPLCEAFPRH